MKTSLKDWPKIYHSGHAIGVHPTKQSGVMRDKDLAHIHYIDQTLRLRHTQRKRKKK